MNGTSPKISDLGVRVASAIVMVAVAGTALWLGGWFSLLFVSAVALGLLVEWQRLANSFSTSAWGKALWFGGGVFYIGLGSCTLLVMRDSPQLSVLVPLVVSSVVAVDVGAYFVGRAIGGPKIAPAISPSKTWAGLLGGMFGAMGVVLVAIFAFGDGSVSTKYLFAYLTLASLAAAVAQAGDFFESWMKRRAGVKDSGSLLPGHGGLFDRVDGLLAVLFCLGLFGLANIFAFILLPYPL